MISVKTILPVVLVSIAAILALVFLLTYFTEETFTGYAGFELNPVLKKPYLPDKPISLSTKGVCVFNNKGINCNNADEVASFCYNSLGVSTPSAATVCSKGYITCELPCGMQTAKCINGDFQVKRC